MRPPGGFVLLLGGAVRGGLLYGWDDPGLLGVSAGPEWLRHAGYALHQR